MLTPRSVAEEILEATCEVESEAVEELLEAMRDMRDKYSMTRLGIIHTVQRAILRELNDIALEDKDFGPATGRGGDGG